MAQSTQVEAAVALVVTVIPIVVVMAVQELLLLDILLVVYRAPQ